MQFLIIKFVSSQVFFCLMGQIQKLKTIFKWSKLVFKVNSDNESDWSSNFLKFYSLFFTTDFCFVEIYSG